MTDHYDCPNCCEWVPLTEKFCPECDAPLTLDAQLEYRQFQLRKNVGPRLFTCPVCLDDSPENFCPHCGRRLYLTDFDSDYDHGPEHHFAGVAPGRKEDSF